MYQHWRMCPLKFLDAAMSQPNAQLALLLCRIEMAVGEAELTLGHTCRRGFLFASTLKQRMA
jgi:hypothetical protein